MCHALHHNNASVLYAIPVKSGNIFGGELQTRGLKQNKIIVIVEDKPTL